MSKRLPLQNSYLEDSVLKLDSPDLDAAHPNAVADESNHDRPTIADSPWPDRMAGAFTLLLIASLGWFVASVHGQYPVCVAPCVPGDESIMAQKEHGTSHTPVMDDLRWGCDWDLADRICNFNRRYAESAGYYATTSFLSELPRDDEDDENPTPVQFYDSNTGKLLFEAPKGRSWNAFLKETSHHGWPSFRDEEVNWEVVRMLENGETVSIDGTHLGHNLPDSSGNRFCINLVSIAGQPQSQFNDADEEEH